MLKKIKHGKIKDLDPDQISDEISGKAIQSVLERRKMNEENYKNSVLIISFMLSVPVVLLFVVVLCGSLDYLELERKVKLPEWLVPVSIFAIVAVFQMTWSFLSCYIEKRFHETRKH